jgi:membrane protein
VGTQRQRQLAEVNHPPTPRFDLRGHGRLLRQVVASWLDDRGPSMGAALAYYTMFSMAPLLLIVVSVAGLVFGADAARGEIQAQLTALMGARGAMAVQELLAGLDRPAEGSAATGVGLGLLLLGATTVFAELQDALDRIWRVPPRAGVGSGISGWLGLVRARVLSFGMILAVGFLLMVSLVVSATLSTLGRLWSAESGPWIVVAATANAVGSFVLVAAMFALIYKVMPRARVAWRDVWTGALFTATLFTLGKSLIGLYVGTSAVTSGFGAAGSLVVVLLWVYWSAQIFLFGAEFTWVYAHSHGSRRPLSVPVAKAAGVRTRPG